MRAEREYIGLVKRLIEQKFRFDSSDGALRQRDLEYLARSIEEKSGIKLSLSTLKRLWRKDYDQTPHPSTLEALVSLLGYEDWQEFKRQQTFPDVAPETRSAARSRPFSRWMILPITAVFVAVFWLIAFRNRENHLAEPLINGTVTLRGNKTVSQGVPSTIIFEYDLSNVVADSFFFQQSWSDLEKVSIEKRGRYHSAIYHYPGFHTAKLIADDSVVSRVAAHITTDGWMTLISYPQAGDNPFQLRKKPDGTNVMLRVTREDLVAARVDVDKPFTLSYFNVREFEGVESDNFSVSAKVLRDKSIALACPGIELVVMCERDMFFVRLMGKGCERDIALKMGEVTKQGVNNDLSLLGRDLDRWQDLQIRVVNKQATISVDNLPVHSITFKGDFGKVVGLACHFNGGGAIDDVTLRGGEETVVYEEESQ